MKTACRERMRQLQQLAFADGLADIPYNFVIGNDSFTYEGRGFKYQGEIPGNSSSKFEDIGLIVAFIGTFDDDQPSQNQLDTFERFLESAVKLNIVAKEFVILMEDEIVFKKKKSKGFIKALPSMIKFGEKFYSSNYLI